MTCIASKLGTCLANLRLKLHGIDPPPNLPLQEKKSGRISIRPQRDDPIATMAQICTTVSSNMHPSHRCRMDEKNPQRANAEGKAKKAQIRKGLLSRHAAAAVTS